MTPVEISHLVKQPQAAAQLLRSKSYGNRVKSDRPTVVVASSSRSPSLQPLARFVYHSAVSEATRFLAPGENDEVLTAEKRHEFL